MPPTQTHPLTDREFAAQMARAGPFEPAPTVAVGVSGGADSMALSLLLHRWLRARDGHLVALTVDHGLRSGAAREARQTKRWLTAQGISHHVLRWQGAKPATAIEAAARDARHGLLGDWCRRNGVLHLLLAHHLDDQAETVLIRLGRGSGPDGLAGMAAMAERGDHRLLRPLLTVPRSRLVAFLRSIDQPWLEDPSNQDAAFTRNRVRAALPSLAIHGIDASCLALAAAKLSHTRAVTDEVAAALAAQAVAIYPAGYCRIDVAALRAAPRPLAARTVAGALLAIGGASYPPRSDRLERLMVRILDQGLDRARTLGGCIVAPAEEGLVISREPGAVQAPVSLAPGAVTKWDRRYAVRLARGGRNRSDRLNVGALGTADWAWLRRRLPDPVSMPRAASLTLPAIRSGPRLIYVPHLGWSDDAIAPPPRISADFQPSNPVARSMFSVV